MWVAVFGSFAGIQVAPPIVEGRQNGMALLCIFLVGENLFFIILKGDRDRGVEEGGHNREQPVLGHVYIGSEKELNAF